MNKWTKTIVCALCGVIAAFSLASCNLQGEVINAYDIAVKNGFTGTEKYMIHTVCHRIDAIRLRKKVKEIDPNAFTVITTTSEIVGRGFRGV